MTSVDTCKYWKVYLDIFIYNAYSLLSISVTRLDRKWFWSGWRSRSVYIYIYIYIYMYRLCSKYVGSKDVLFNVYSINLCHCRCLFRGVFPVCFGWWRNGSSDIILIWYHAGNWLVKLSSYRWLSGYFFRIEWKLIFWTTLFGINQTWYSCRIN